MRGTLKSSFNIYAKRFICLLLIFIMSLPYIVIAEESAWLNLPEIEPRRGSFPAELYAPDYNEVRRQSLLSRMSEYDMFTAEERFIVDNPDFFTDGSFINEFDDGLDATRRENERELMEFTGLINSGRSYSELSESDRFLILNQLNITESREVFERVNAVFIAMEQNGFSLFEITERLRYELENDLEIGSTFRIMARQPDEFIFRNKPKPL
jgi:hypothetical protein